MQYLHSAKGYIKNTQSEHRISHLFHLGVNVSALWMKTDWRSESSLPLQVHCLLLKCSIWLLLQSTYHLLSVLVELCWFTAVDNNSLCSVLALTLCFTSLCLCSNLDALTSVFVDSCLLIFCWECHALLYTINSVIITTYSHWTRNQTLGNDLVGCLVFDCNQGNLQVFSWPQEGSHIVP